ncbi:hypothetical protein ABTZ03_24500 [Kitasatospora sp. NPDC096077]|uniref:hypothetical protein n=1 Tax=Kitasatospora sp. NPDC096077 TaxID=3155544 RepID=UPI00332F5B6E
MHVLHDSLPALRHPEAESALVGLLLFRGEESLRAAAQRAAAEAVVDHWRASGPARAALSLNCLVSTDNRALLSYEQWPSERAVRDYLADGEATAAAAGLPGVTDHFEPVHYRLYRSSSWDTTRAPGCILIAAFELDEAGPDGPGAGRAWADAVLDSLDAAHAAGDAPEGALGAHFHISADGRHVLNYAEWTSEEAHAAFMVGAQRRQALGRVGGMPTKTSPGNSRYRLFRALSAAPDGRPATA